MITRQHQRPWRDGESSGPECILYALEGTVSVAVRVAHNSESCDCCESLNDSQGIQAARKIAGTCNLQNLEIRHPVPVQKGLEEASVILPFHDEQTGGSDAGLLIDSRH